MTPARLHSIERKHTGEKPHSFKYETKKICKEKLSILYESMLEIIGVKPAPCISPLKVNTHRGKTSLPKI